jgi:Zn-dependent oligopeptidase
MISNLPKPTKEAPSLFQHHDVITLFHEFGHLIHALCNRSHWNEFSGINVQWGKLNC